MPLVSVIVPCYDVAAYVDECLASITSQTHADLEIIAVDDGSTDDTPHRIAEWARRDPRITIITQTNRGLGAARNTGLEVATGRYITLVDSDDVLPPTSIAMMVASAESTGSDLVTGLVRLFDEHNTWNASFHGGLFAEGAQRTHLFERPELLRDHIACGKLFRREFWEREISRFPENVLFEDIEVATRAHVFASAVDVVADTVYLWRSRPEGDASITQDRRRPGGVSDRFAALTAVDRLLRESAPESVWIGHVRKVFDSDLRTYLKLLDAGDDAYVEEFMEAARLLMESLAPASVEAQGRLARRIHHHIVGGDLRAVRGLSRVMSSRPLSVGKLWTGLAMLPWRDRALICLLGPVKVLQRLTQRAVSAARQRAS